MTDQESSRQDLSVLMTAAADAAPSERIQYRDGIASYGDEAIGELSGWLADPRLRAFAIRTIVAAAPHGTKERAVAALRTVDASAPDYIGRDVDAALASLGTRRSSTVTAPQGHVDPDGLDDDLYTHLVEEAGHHRYVTYTEAARVVGLSMRNPHHRKVIGQLLGRISQNEALQSRPMLSSIVVSKDATDKLGSGFYQLGRELALMQKGEDERTFAKREATRTFDYWSLRVRIPGGPTATGAPDYRTRGPREAPPDAIGPCGFTGSEGACQNPGRWDRDGILSCTTHALARKPTPWTR
jgi:hypothetical protein